MGMNLSAEGEKDRCSQLESLKTISILPSWLFPSRLERLTAKRDLVVLRAITANSTSVDVEGVMKSAGRKKNKCPHRWYRGRTSFPLSVAPYCLTRFNIPRIDHKGRGATALEGHASNGHEYRMKFSIFAETWRGIRRTEGRRRRYRE